MTVEDGPKGGPDPDDWWDPDEPFDESEPGDWSRDPRVSEGLEHLQRAAREVIEASRALLDVAEDLVADPRTAIDVVGLIGRTGEVAARLAGRVRPASGHHGVDDEDDPPVQRIPVS